MPIKPNAAQKQTFDRLFFCVGEAIEEGVDWAEQTTPGARERIKHLLNLGFRARMTIERTPALHVVLELIGEHAEHGPTSVEVFRYQADRATADLHLNENACRTVALPDA